jgi:hypothetical protein
MFRGQQRAIAIQKGRGRCWDDGVGTMARRAMRRSCVDNRSQNELKKIREELK